jgi:hypothetical protein
MKRLILSLLCGLSVGFSSTYAAEVVQVDAQSRNVINTGIVNFANNQLRIGGVVVGPGGGGGGGGISAISLNLPILLFDSPVTFTVDSSGNAIGTAALTTAPQDTLLANLTGGSAVPTWTSLSALKVSAGLDHVDNTTDANKPVSSATQTALDLKANSSDMAAALAGKATPTDISDALTAYAGSSAVITLGTVTTGTWNATAIANTYLPALNGLSAPTGNLSLASNKIINLADPSNATDAVNKQYVDSVAVTGPPHPAVAVASTAAGGNLTLSGEQTIDGILTSASRILVKNQTTASENGIYVTAAGAWTRAIDADANAEVSGSVFVSSGTANAGTTWGLTTPQPVTLGTTDLAYTQTGANTVYSAGTGLSLSGSVFSLANLSGNGKLMGRYTAGAGSPQEITISTGLALDGSGNLTVTSGGLTSFTSGNLALTGTPATLFTTALGGTPLTSPALTFSLTNAPANTFFGNSGSGVGYMTAAQARLSLGGTTVGQNLFQLTSPSAIRFLKINADNSVTAETAAAHLTSIGAESALTFNAPFTRAPGTDIIGMSVASAAPASGYLQGSDFVKFNAGYIASPQTVLASTCTGTAPCTLNLSSPLANPRINQVLLDTVMTNPLRIVLPAATNYGSAWAYESIEIFDIVGGAAQSNSGVTVRIARSFSDTIDGSTNDLVLPRGVTYARLSPDSTGTKWTSTYYYVNSVKDPSDPLKAVTFNAANQAGSPAPSPGRVTFAPGESVTLNVTDPLLVPHGVIRDINDNGTVVKSTLNPMELVPNEDPIGTAGSNLSSYTFTSDNSGTTDTIRIAGNLNAPLTIRWPYASNYASGKRLALIDASGTVGPTHPVTILSVKPVVDGGPDTFSGQNVYVMDEPYGQRVFVSNGTNEWSVPVAKGTIIPFTPPTNGNTLSISGNTSAIQHNAHWNLAAGANNLFVTNPYDGMQIELVLVQPATQATLNLPAPSYVASTGNGLITLSSGGSKIDRLHGEYDAAVPGFLWDLPRLDHTSAALPAAPTTMTATGATSAKVDLHWVDASTTEQGFKVYRTIAGQQFGSPLPAPFPAGSSPASTTGGTFNYTDNTVTPGTTYDYRVRSFNAAGDSTGFASTSGVVIPSALTADIWELHLNPGSSGDTSTSATVPTGTTAALDPASWAIPAGANDTSAGAWVGGAGMAAMSSSVVATCTGTCASNYTYNVFAFTASGKHNATTNISTGAVANAVLGGANFNTISWTAVTGADHYEIYRVTGPATIGKISTATNIPQATTSFVDVGAAASGALPGTTATDGNTITGPVETNLTYGTSQVLTVSMWVKSTWPSNTNVIALQSLNTKISTVSPNKLNFQMGGNTGTLAGTVALNVDPATPPIGSNVNAGTHYHHIVVEFNNSQATNTMTASPTVGASDTVKVYLDNVQVAIVWGTSTRSGAASFPASKPVIGSNAFTGNIDDVRIFGRLLTYGVGSEIETLYNTGPQ